MAPTPTPAGTDVQGIQFPPSQLKYVDECLQNVEKWFESGDWKNTNPDSVRQLAVEGMSSLDKAKNELAYMYILNALFWAYYRTTGEVALINSMQKELIRIKTQLERVSEIENKSETATGRSEIEAQKCIQAEDWEGTTNTTTATAAASVSSTVVSYVNLRKRRHDQLDADVSSVDCSSDIDNLSDETDTDDSTIYID